MKRSGQALVEYTLILALVSVVSIYALTQLGQSIKGTFEKINSSLVVADQSTSNPNPGGGCPGNNGNQGNGNNGHHYGQYK